MTDGDEKDIELIRMYISGDEHAGKELYERLNERLVKFLTSLHPTGYSLPIRCANAENSAHDAWLILVNSPELYDPAKGTVKNWLFGVGKNCLYSGYIRGRKNSHYLHHSDEILNYQVHDICPSKDIDLINLLNRLDHFNSKHKEIILLKLEGHTTPEIASLLDISIEATKSRTRRALDAAREALGEINE